MAHGHHRYFASAIGNKPASDFLCAIAGGIHDVFAAHFALFGFNDPFVVLSPHTSDRAKAYDARTSIASTFGERLSQLGGINVAIVGVVQTAFEVVRFQKRVAVLQVAERTHLDVHALIATHASHTFELLHALSRMRQPDRAGHVVVHRVVDLVRQSTIQLGRVTLHIHDRPGGRERRNIACCMPGRT